MKNDTREILIVALIYFLLSFALGAYLTALIVGIAYGIYFRREITLNQAMIVVGLNSILFLLFTVFAFLVSLRLPLMSAVGFNLMAALVLILNFVLGVALLMLGNYVYCYLENNGLVDKYLSK